MKKNYVPIAHDVVERLDEQAKAMPGGMDRNDYISYLLDMREMVINPPRGKDLYFVFELKNETPDEVKAAIEQTLDRIAQALDREFGIRFHWGAKKKKFRLFQR